MTTLGTVDSPFELRPTAKDRFYAVFDDFLDSADSISTAPWVAPASVTISGEDVNAAPLELDGVTYGANRVASVLLEGIERNNVVALECTMTSAAGRVEPVAVWVKGVKNYS